MSAIKKIIMNSLELPRESEKHIKDNPEMETKFHDSANHCSHLTERLFEREFTGAPESHAFKKNLVHLQSMSSIHMILVLMILEKC